MLILLLFAIILQVTNVSAPLCPDNFDAKSYCSSILCTDQETNGEIAFRVCMRCFPTYLNEQCPKEIAKHYEHHVTAEKTRLFHVKKNEPHANTRELVVTEQPPVKVEEIGQIS